MNLTVTILRHRAPWVSLILALSLVACANPTGEALPETPVAAAPLLAGDAEAGREVWGGNGCAACHTLHAAQATGTIGPNLDQSSLSYEDVIRRVTEGQGTMPSYAGLLTADQIQDVAAFVIAAASGETAVAPEALPTQAEPASVSPLRAVDLAQFAATWSSGDLEAIRSLYADDALYLSAEEVVALQHQEAVSATVESEDFAEDVASVDGLSLRILGEPQQVTDKQVMFFFRWEGETEGTNGVALLRTEGNKVWMHTYALDRAPTPNPGVGEELLEPFDVEPLMQAWRSQEVEPVRAFYTEDLAIFNDEDILRSSQGQFRSQSELEGEYLSSEVREHGTWGMSALAPALRLGDLVLFAWNWEAHAYPVGYGVRFLRLEGDQIAQDLRYALRPWEVGGASFASGY